MLVQKTIRIRKDEEEKILRDMRLNGETNFSEYIRNKIFPMINAADIDEIVEKSCQETIRLVDEKIRSSQLEKIFLELHKISVLSEASGQFEEMNMRIVMTCLQDLLIEVRKTLPLSDEFVQKWYL